MANKNFSKERKRGREEGGAGGGRESEKEKKEEERRRSGMTKAIGKREKGGRGGEVRVLNEATNFPEIYLRINFENFLENISMKDQLESHY